MPVFEYACSNCNHTMDKFQKTLDQDPTECSECGQHSLQRQMSATAFALKGTGWYVTDFKGGKKPKSTESGKADDKADDKGGKKDKKTELKKDKAGSAAKEGNKDSNAGSGKATGSTSKKSAKPDKD